jgi:hypothetical protein
VSESVDGVNAEKKSRGVRILAQTWKHIGERRMLVSGNYVVTSNFIIMKLLEEMKMKVEDAP